MKYTWTIFTMSWVAGTMVNNTCWSSWGAQPPHSSLQWSGTPHSGDLIPYPGLYGHQAHMCTNILSVKAPTDIK